jgi:hypothetical protein
LKFSSKKTHIYNSTGSTTLPVRQCYVFAPTNSILTGAKKGS